MSTEQNYVGKGNYANPTEQTVDPTSLTVRSAFTSQTLQLSPRKQANLATRPRQYNRKPLSQRAVPASIRFAINPNDLNSNAPEVGSLNVTIRLRNEDQLKIQTAVSNFGSQLRIKRTDWLAERQRSQHKDDPINHKLRTLEKRVDRIYTEQQKSGLAPTAKSVLIELESGERPRILNQKWQYTAQTYTPQQAATLFAQVSPNSSLEMAYQAYIAHLHAQKYTHSGLSDISLGRWAYGLKLLNAYADHTGLPLPSVNKLTIGWGKRFHTWLQTKKGGSRCPRPISVGQASRFVLKISNVLDWLIEDDLISSNPLGRVSWPKLPDKEVNFLEPQHIHKLLQLGWDGTEGVALWWFLLMCCTGLDYPDAKAYARDRAAHERKGPQGTKLVGKRNKPPHGEYHLPLLDEVEALFSMCPRGPIFISSACINRHTNQIEKALGISWRITNKTARKTFGCLMLAAGHRIADVSLMMGHSRIVTTERYYVKVRGESIDRAMSRVKVNISQLMGDQQSTDGIQL